MDYLLNGFIKSIYLLINFDAQTYSAIITTVKASSYSMIISLTIGIPLGFCLGYFNFFGKKIIKILVNTGLSLPTVFIGLLVYAFLTYNGPLGSFGLLFTIKGIALAQTILALPIVIALCASACENIDKNLRNTIISFGANRFQLFKTILWEARHQIIIAALTAYGRVLTEVGISMMVGGNIKWHTRTITTAIALETNKGMFSMGIALGLVLLVLALIINISVSFFHKK